MPGATAQGHASRKSLNALLMPPRMPCQSAGVSLGLQTALLGWREIASGRGYESFHHIERKIDRTVGQEVKATAIIVPKRFEQRTCWEARRQFCELESHAVADNVRGHHHLEATAP